MKPGELQAIRDALGLTQEELADHLGVHRVTVARWESGTRAIPEMAVRLLRRIQAEQKKRKR